MLDSFAPLEVDNLRRLAMLSSSLAPVYLHFSVSVFGLCSHLSQLGGTFLHFMALALLPRPKGMLVRVHLIHRSHCQIGVAFQCHDRLMTPLLQLFA